MNRVFEWILFAALILGICGNVSTDISSDGSSIQDLGNKLADSLPTGLPPLPSQIPSEEEAKTLLKEKCERLGGSGAYERVESAKDEVQACVQSLVNVTELQEEMEAAKPTGDLDTVFRKYCRKSPAFTECISNFTATMEPCLEEREKESKRIVQNITEALLSFVCYKEGDRIALFIAEGGPECFQSKQQEIQQCANSTVGKYAPVQDGAGSISQIPLLVLGDSECQSFNELRECVVNALEKCSEPTPANIVESLFQFVYKMTPCHKNKKQHQEASLRGSNSAIQASNMPVLFLTAIALLTMIGAA